MSTYAPQSESRSATPDPVHRAPRRELAQVLVLVVTFVVLMLAGSVVGFKVITSPPERDAREISGGPYAKSRVTYKSADGLTCRTLEFDNKSGLAREGKPEPCYQGPSIFRQRSFVWGR